MSADVFNFEDFKYKQFALEFVDTYTREGPHVAVDLAVQKGYTADDFLDMFQILRNEFERQGHYEVLEDKV